jgi:hypothetical protein
LALAACEPENEAALATPFDPSIAVVRSSLNFGFDYNITITSSTDVTNRRNALNQFIWGSSGMPMSKMPSSVALNVTSPVPGLANLQRVDQINISMAAGQTSLAYHFIPNQYKKNKLVILHAGHGDCGLADGLALTDDPPSGFQRTIQNMLWEGYSVLAVFMLVNVPGDCEGITGHDFIFDNVSLPAGTGDDIQFFFEPLTVSLNYLQAKATQDSFPSYTEFDMVGLSGGGWETTVYPALDTRIRISIPVAGTVPLYMRQNAYPRDEEQTHQAFYNIAGYPDLYVMAAYGVGRRHIQVLNRKDTCCFGEAQHQPSQVGGLSWADALREYEMRVRATLFSLPSPGFFHTEIDEAAPDHQISWNTVVGTIMTELNGGKRFMGAGASTDAFVRGMNGHLWHYGDSIGGWEDTGIAMVGVPSAIHGGPHAIDVFCRDNHDQPIQVFKSGSTWTSSPLPGLIINDPVAATTGSGQFDMVALGTDYHVYHWSPAGLDVLSTTPALGQLALLAASGRVDVYARAFDRSVFNLRKIGTGATTVTSLFGTIFDFPTATTTTSGSSITRRVYVRGQNSQLFEATSTNDATFSFFNQIIPPGIGGNFIGTPSAGTGSNAVSLFVRHDGTNSLAIFTLPSGGSWSFTDVGGIITGSPHATGSAAHLRGQSAGLFLFDTAYHSRSGMID